MYLVDGLDIVGACKYCVDILNAAERSGEAVSVTVCHPVMKERRYSTTSIDEKFRTTHAIMPLSTHSTHRMIDSRH